MPESEITNENASCQEVLMPKLKEQNQQDAAGSVISLDKSLRHKPWMRIWVRGSAAALALAAFAVAANSGPQTAQQQVYNQSGPDRPLVLGSANPVPDANAQMGMHDQQNKDKAYKALNAERSKQIANDSAKLLKLATDLKAEVDKTTKDELSINVIRKADEIEKLAHAVREKMKLEFAN
jgi:hypothetical protein